MEMISNSLKSIDGNFLSFFPHAEGYVKATPLSLGNNIAGYAYNYVFNYTDHLGNVRLSYSKDPQTSELKILEENHYYPFGLKHSVYSGGRLKGFKATLGSIGGTVLTPVTKTDYNYKYNGFEYQDELGLGWYDYLARNYDPALGRWMNIDPLAEMSRKTSPYAYALNNPVFFIDPDGMMAESFDQDMSIQNDWIPNGDGTYTAEAGDSAGTLARDAGIDFNRANELVESQLGDNYTGTDGGIQSSVEVGDVVTVPEQVPVELETADIGGVSINKEIDNQVKEIDKKINELSKDIKDSHNKHQVLESAEKFDRIWVDRMEGGVPGRTAGAAKLQQMYARDSVNKSKERTSLQNNKEALSKSKK